MALRGLRYDEPVSGPDVAVDAVGSPAENYQILKPAFGVEGSASLVHEAQPLPARDYHGGTTPFDSGLQAVPAGAPASIGVNVDSWVDAVLFVNLTGQNQTIAIENGVGDSYGSQVLEPNEWRLRPLAGMLFDGGFKIGAENASAVSVQLKGTQ
jgi:hypothetical protein